MNENNILSNIPQTLTTMQTQDKGLPFQIIHRFIALVRLTHRSESARKSSNIMFSDDELVIISHLEQAATDLRCANPELIEQAKKILSESPFVPKVSNYKRHLLACVELLLIEVKARQKNPALYDFLYQGTLWYYHNHSELPKEVVGEIQHYLTFGNPYLTPEEEQKQDELFEEIIACSEKQKKETFSDLLKRFADCIWQHVEKLRGQFRKE